MSEPTRLVALTLEESGALTICLAREMLAIREYLNNRRNKRVREDPLYTDDVCVTLLQRYKVLHEKLAYANEQLMNENPNKG